MKKFFDPQSAALIGASSTPMRPGNNLFLSMHKTMGERFYPVNPKAGEIGGRKCYPSILDTPEAPDLAVIFVPAKAVPEALRQCGERGVGRVIIESGGFAEAGEEGMAFHRECLDIAKRHGIRIWGPNCMGVINVHRMKVLSFMSPMVWEDRFIKGNVSMVVQSGMLSAGFLIQILSETPFGLSKVCSIGNKMDVDESDLLEYMIGDDETGVIAMYLESLVNGRRFFELAKKCDKPLVVLKSGRTELGAGAAASHTAALAQDDAVVGAAFRQAGVIRASGMKEMMDVARALGSSRPKKVKSPKVAVLTFSGGAGVVTSDDLHDRGMGLAELGPETLSRMQKVYPEWMEPSNPADLYPGIEKHGPKKTFGETFEAVISDPGVDAVYMHVFAPPVKIQLYDFDRLAELMKLHGKPVVAWILGSGERAREMGAELESRGVPVVDEIGKGVRILSALAQGK